MECSGVLPTTQFAYQKGLDACDAHLCMSHTLQSALESGRDATIVQIDDESTLMAFVRSPGVRVPVVESLIHDLGKISEWCDLWGRKLNASKTKTMIVSRSCIMHPKSPPLTIG